ncbi:MAG: fibronectin type III domain-containing protein [Pseudomonadales bacterium]|nr:fibronectin type III domain-containing protein [Pseudomonadales bacterium]
MATVSDPPKALANDAANTSHTQVTFTWAAPASNGVSAVLDYKVFWDQGTNNFVELEGATALTTKNYTKTGVTEGTTYKFKVQARNTVGYSSESSTVSILAASVPATPVAPTTALSENNIVVTWTKPATMGSEVTSYKIYLQKSDSTWSLETANCHGSSSTVVSNLSCTIPIVVLEAAPFNLAGLAKVHAKITATNIIGKSLESPSGNGGYIAVLPGAPQNVA